MAVDMNLLPMFRAVAEADNFRVAADRLGVSRSAVSQAVRRLEDHFGTVLVLRTTRSVRLTEAGERLFGALSRPLSEIDEALEALASEESPRGVLRIVVTSIAERILSGPLLAEFARVCPDVILDVAVTDDEFDFVARGFDAAIRLRAVVEKDMIVVPVSGEQREMVVAAPAYLDAHGVPSHPRDLIRHRCIGWRPAPDVAPYRWEFAEDGKLFDVAVEPRITTNDLRLMLRTTLAGGGLTFATAETFAPYVARGALVSVLESFLPPFPGFFLAFPERRNMAPKLRAFIDHVRWNEQ